MKRIFEVQTSSWWMHCYRGKRAYYLTVAQSPFKRARRRVYTDLETAQTGALLSAYCALSLTRAQAFHSSLR